MTGIEELVDWLLDCGYYEGPTCVQMRHALAKAFELGRSSGQADKSRLYTEAANLVLARRDDTVMSKYASQAECRAARDALWEAAADLQNVASLTSIHSSPQRRYTGENQ